MSQPTVDLQPTQRPRVTMIVACYNYGHFVAQAIDSLLGQTFEALEVIVIDDASADDTPRVLERYRDTPRVRIIRHPQNQGNIRTYNEGIGLACGEFVGVLAADDYCQRPDALARQVAVFDAHPRVGYVHTANLVVDEQGQPLFTRQHWSVDCVRPGMEEFADLIFGVYVEGSGMLVRMTAHESVGVYDPLLPHAGDWDLLFRLTRHYDAGYVADQVYAKRMHSRNMSTTLVHPRQGIDEKVECVKRAFDALPASAPVELRQARTAAIRKALLSECNGDRALGRTRRSWHGLMHALWRSPDLLAAPIFYQSLARQVAVTTLGNDRYVRLAARTKLTAGTSPASTNGK